MIEDMETSVPPPPEEGGNRMFLIGAIILTAFSISLVGIHGLLNFMNISASPKANYWIRFFI